MTSDENKMDDLITGGLIERDQLLDTIASLRSELAEKEKQIEEWKDKHALAYNSAKLRGEKNKNLESLCEAADKVITNTSYENLDTVKYQELVNAYHQLKNTKP